MRTGTDDPALEVDVTVAGMLTWRRWLAFSAKPCSPPITDSNTVTLSSTAMRYVGFERDTEPGVSREARSHKVRSSAVRIRQGDRRSPKALRAHITRSGCSRSRAVDTFSNVLLADLTGRVPA
jgi:hypothetical protein